MRAAGQILLFVVVELAAPPGPQEAGLLHQADRDLLPPEESRAPRGPRGTVEAPDTVHRTADAAGIPIQYVDDTALLLDATAAAGTAPTNSQAR